MRLLLILFFLLIPFVSNAQVSYFFESTGSTVAGYTTFDAEDEEVGFIYLSTTTQSIDTVHTYQTFTCVDCDIPPLIELHVIRLDGTDRDLGDGVRVASSKEIINLDDLDVTNGNSWTFTPFTMTPDENYAFVLHTSGHDTASTTFNRVTYSMTNTIGNPRYASTTRWEWDLRTEGDFDAQNTSFFPRMKLGVGSISPTRSTIEIYNPTDEDEYTSASTTVRVDALYTIVGTEFDTAGLTLYNFETRDIVDGIAVSVGTGTDAIGWTFDGLEGTTTYEVVANLYNSDDFESFIGGSLSVSDHLYLHIFAESPYFTAIINPNESGGLGTYWETEGCDSLGLTDVFPAIKCAFIWAFVPDYSIWQQFTGVVGNLSHIFPIGYARVIFADFRDATLMGTSTTFDLVDIDLQAINLADSTTTVSLFSLTEVNNYLYGDSSLSLWISRVEGLIYALFVVWLVWFGYTRRL